MIAQDELQRVKTEKEIEIGELRKTIGTLES